MRSGTQRDERRRRYMAKQETIAAGIPLHHKSRENVTITPHLDDDDNDQENRCVDTLWMNQHSHMCQALTINDINLLKRYRMISDQKQADINNDDGELTFDDHGGQMSQEQLLHMDRLLSPYFDIQHQDLPSRTYKYDQRLRFIAEGTETVRLLIQQQGNMNDTESLLWHEPIQLESIFMKQNLFFSQPVHLKNDVDIILKSIRQDQLPEQQNEETKSPSPFHVLLASMETMSAVAGFTVSRGCLACGYIPIHRTEEWFFEKVNRHLVDATTTNSTFRLLAFDGITDTANLGSMIRTASAFGIHAILLSNDCCDAWYRRSIRVSMGHIFRIPTVRVINLSDTLHILSQPPYNVTSYAAVVDPKSSIALHQVKFGTVPNRWCCVMGNEANGITADVIAKCTYSLRIDMEPGVDSLSVPIATGILLHGIRERENKIIDHDKDN